MKDLLVISINRKPMLAVRTYTPMGQMVQTEAYFPVYDHEKDMNRGRFARFRVEPFESFVHVTNVAHRPKTLIEWIAENVQGDWSMMPHDPDIAETPLHDTTTFVFSFEKAVDAVVFKLVFS
jgi:hypothetical protein